MWYGLSISLCKSTFKRPTRYLLDSTNICGLNCFPKQLGPTKAAEKRSNAVYVRTISDACEAEKKHLTQFRTRCGNFFEVQRERITAKRRQSLNFTLLFFFKRVLVNMLTSLMLITLLLLLYGDHRGEVASKSRQDMSPRKEYGPCTG